MLKEKLTQQKTTPNCQIYETLLFDRDLDQWVAISHAINVLLSYSIIGMSNDQVLSDKRNQDCLQELIFFKTEIDVSVNYTLSNIPKEKNQ